MNRRGKWFLAAAGVAALGLASVPPAQAKDEKTEKIVVIREGDEASEDRGGYLGVNVREETEGADGGARVISIVPDSPASKAGLRKGDVIVGMDGKAIRGPGKLTQIIHESAAGAEVSLEVLRDGKRMKVAATLGERPRSFGFSFWTPEREMELDRDLQRLEEGEKLKFKMDKETREEVRRAMEDARRAMEDARRELGKRAPELHEHMKSLRHLGPRVWSWSWPGGDRPRLGVELVETTPELREHLGGAKDAGVLVGRVLPDTPAAKAGVKVGDMIVTLDGERIEETSDLIEAVAEHAGKTVDLEVVRDGKTTILKVAFPEVDGEDEHRGPRASLAPRAPIPPMPPEPAAAPEAPLPPPPPPDAV